jgi:hypothetical protein
MEKKLPDSYVPDRKTKEYPTEVGSVKFSPDDIQLFKLEKTSKLKHHFTSKFSEIQNQYQQLIEEIQLNERLYSAQHNFQPIPGKSYYLYIKDDGQEFLSLVSPQEWGDKFEYVGTYEFLYDGRWQSI